MNRKNKAKQKVWELYDSWRREKIFSPALKCNIRFSLLGWKHITGVTGSKKRVFSDVYRRLKLLPFAKEIILESTTIQDMSVINGSQFYALEAIKIVDSKPRKIRVVLLEDKKKNKIFLSVMDKKKR